MKYSSNSFRDAVKNTSPERGQIAKIAEIVGCSEATAIKRCRKLAEESDGEIEVDTRKAYDKQSDPYGQGLFGGAGACVRRFLVVSFTDKTLRLAQYDN